MVKIYDAEKMALQENNIKSFESIYPDFFDAGHAGKYYDRERLIQIKNRIKNNNKRGDKC